MAKILYWEFSSLALVEKLSLCQVSCHIGRVIDNNSVTFDHFYVTLDQRITFLVTLDIVAKDNFSTSVAKIIVRNRLLGVSH